MSAATEVPWRRSGEVILLRVRLTPKGGRDAVDGTTATADGAAIKARVRAAPEDGAANAALTDCIAAWLGLARRDVTLASGHKSRTKVLAIAGEAAAIEKRLEAAVMAFAQRSEKD